jgi:hypothetical protein
MSDGIESQVDLQNQDTDLASAAKIAQIIFGLEQKIDLTNPLWIEGDVHWWPMYRIQLYQFFFLALAAPGAIQNSTHRIGPIFKRADTVHRNRIDSPVWLVSGGASWINIGDELIDRFCDPLRDACINIDQSAIVIDSGSLTRPEKTRAIRWWAPLTQRAKVFGYILSRLKPDTRHKELVSMINNAAKGYVNIPKLDPRLFDAKSRAIQRLANQLELRMRQENVAAVAVVCYYDVAGYAYLLAAARIGIPSIDIQHGVTGQYHLAYSKWPSRQDGWNLLPRWFWTWTEDDAMLVRQWANLMKPNHLAVCGGHPFLHAWRNGAIQLGGKDQKKLDSLLDASSGRKRVIVTLQPYLCNFEGLGPLLQTWRQYKEIHWWLRLHPVAYNDGVALRQLLKENGVQYFDIDITTTLPLPILLSHADVHATHSSSTVIEAATLGIGSIVWSKYGAELFDDILQRGSACLALDAEAFRNAIDYLTALPPINTENEANLKQALCTILKP